MIRKHKGIQSQIISENLKAFFVPCIAHSLNLLLGDMEKSVPCTVTFLVLFKKCILYFPDQQKDGVYYLKTLQIIYIKTYIYHKMRKQNLICYTNSFAIGLSV